VFPIGAFVCFLFNTIQYFSLLQEFEVKRRTLPAISYGIGSFLWYLDAISHLSIIINCAIAYFTSKAYRRILIGEGKWFSDTAAFILFVIFVEHLVLFIKMLIQRFAGEESAKYLFEKSRRINNLIIAQHEATQSMVLEKRIRDGDSNAISLKNRFAKLDLDSLDILEKRSKVVKRRKPPINYLYNHYQVEPISYGKNYLKEGSQLDRIVNFELFPKKRVPAGEKALDSEVNINEKNRFAKVVDKFYDKE
jgi:hypothetical protein